jgi:hypothetical protein
VTRGRRMMRRARQREEIKRSEKERQRGSLPREIEKNVQKNSSQILEDR